MIIINKLFIKIVSIETIKNLDGKTMRNQKTIGLALLLTLFVANFNMFINLPLCSAAANVYSPGLIAELGEASTVLVYSQVDATVKV